jgi:hypothetical protein
MIPSIVSLYHTGSPYKIFWVLKDMRAFDDGAVTGNDNLAWNGFRHQFNRTGITTGKDGNYDGFYREGLHFKSGLARMKNTKKNLRPVNNDLVSFW